MVILTIMSTTIGASIIHLNARLEYVDQHLKHNTLIVSMSSSQLLLLQGGLLNRMATYPVFIYVGTLVLQDWTGSPGGRGVSLEPVAFFHTSSPKVQLLWIKSTTVAGGHKGVSVLWSL